MKTLAVVAVVALCAINAAFGFGNNLNTFQNGIARQKQTVQSTINRLDRAEKQFTFDLNRKLGDAKINSMQEINSIVNPTLKSIEDATKQSTAEGKDASGCYEAARAALREYSMAGFSDLESCRNEALSSVTTTQDNMRSTITVGRQVISHLDSIFPSCFTTSIQQMESCIVGKLPEATQLVRSFDSTANDIINSSGSVAITAQTNAINCNRGPVATVRDGATSAQQNANRCIAAL